MISSIHFCHHDIDGAANYFADRGIRFTRVAPRLCRSLRAVKVLLALLRSTLTALASQMRGLYRFALEQQLQCPFSESAHGLIADPRVILIDFNQRSNCRSRKFSSRGLLTFLRESIGSSAFQANCPNRSAIADRLNSRIR